MNINSSMTRRIERIIISQQNVCSVLIQPDFCMSRVHNVANAINCHTC